jgi:uncharacterized membrane protein YfcA
MIAYTLVALLGLVHGLINANAAGGTSLTLPLLVLCGFPPIANGSERIALVVSGITRLVVFHKARVVDWRNGFKLVLPAAIGAFLGARLEVGLSARAVGWAIGAGTVLAFVLVLTGGRSLVGKAAQTEARVLPQHWLVFAAIGVWGGFLAVEAATFFLWSLVVLVGYGLARGNALKALLMLTVSAISLPAFAASGEVNYLVGALLAGGSMAGSWIGAKFALRESSKIWVYRLWLAVVPIELAGFLWKNV